jgi:predicted SprT family Zn-dependent metalloprotease
MKLNDAAFLAVALMEKHGLVNQGWRFKFDNARRRFGVCKHRSKVIGLSQHLVALNDEAKVKDTILHEIAHALVGRGHGHDSVWKRKALEIGCNGERCYDSNKVSMPQSKYIAVCVGCNETHKKHRMTKTSSSCGACSGGKYNPSYKLEWKLNPDF